MAIASLILPLDAPSTSARASEIGLVSTPPTRWAAPRRCNVIRAIHRHGIDELTALHVGAALIDA
jgi:hypothetical protein